MLLILLRAYRMGDMGLENMQWEDEPRHYYTYGLINPTVFFSRIQDENC